MAAMLDKATKLFQKGLSPIVRSVVAFDKLMSNRICGIRSGKLSTAVKVEVFFALEAIPATMVMVAEKLMTPPNILKFHKTG